MSDLEDDIDDQLLALAGATDRKEKRRSKNKSSRKRKNTMDSDSERDGESEGETESDEGSTSNPYPYEGQYIDEEDKERLLALPEIKREEILAERIEEMQRITEKQVLAQMVKQQQSGGAVGMDDDSVARSAKRQHTARGATKEKTRKLDELKAKRKAKDESRKRAKLSPTQQRRSSSPQDMDISEEESDDGQFARSDQEDEKDRRSTGNDSKKPDAPPTLQDFNDCRVTRDTVAKWSMAPWFETYMKGAWVRYLIGNSPGTREPVYRLCEVADLAPDFVKPYKINEKTVNQAFLLRHGDSIRQWNMDRISNSEITDSELRWLERSCKKDGVKLPSQKELHDKAKAMRKQESEPVTDSVITAMLQRKKQLQSTKSSSELMLERSRLAQARSLALRRLDHKEAAELEEKIATLEAELGTVSGSGSTGGSPRKPVDERDEALRRVNERNRKANLEHVRRAELAEQERKKKERELIAKAVASGEPVAKLRTISSLSNATPNSTRPGTPAAYSNGSTPVPSAASNADVRDIPTANTTMAFEKKLLENVDIDLGDF